jgi:membrane fusion protein, macrolide-specific efflux system
MLGDMTRRRRTVLLNVLLVFVLVGVAVGGYLMVSGGGSNAQASTTRAVPVSTADVTSTVTASGNLSAVNQVAANFSSSGTVTSIKAVVGDKVVKGQTLATIDTADATTALALAQSNYASAKAQLVKAEDGATVTTPAQTDATGKVVKAATSTTTVDAAQVASAKAQVVQAKSNLATAKTALAATTLTAPISGTVLAVNGIVGSTSGSSSGSGTAAGASTSSSSSDFIVIADLTKMAVDVSFSESDISKVKVGQAAALTFSALSGVTATGKVVSISPQSTISNSVVTYAAVVHVTAVPVKVRLGQSTSVTITVASAKNAIVVPTLAITTRGDRSFVDVVKDGVVTATQVTLGVAGSSYTQILTGLTVGQQVQLDLSAASSTTSTSSSSKSGAGAGLVGGP